MAADDILDGLASFDGRIAGSDAERRAAAWLAGQLRSGRGERRRHHVRVETFWCHPNWALAAVWHVTLALIASLVAVSAPKVGGAMLLVAIVSTILDAHTGYSLGRLLTPYRASQNVHAGPGAAPSAEDGPAVTLLITAAIDDPRAGLISRPALRRLTRRLRALAGPVTPGWAGWLALTMALVLATTVARAEGSNGTTIGALQLVPTVALLLALALLADQASAGPAAGLPAARRPGDAAPAAAVALLRTLQVAPPANLRVELLLQGAGDGGALGLRRHLRAHRISPPEMVVLALDTTRTAELGWWFSDGPLLPLRTLPILRGRLEALTGRGNRPAPVAIRGRGWGPAFPALLRRIPAAQIGAPPDQTDALVSLALQLVDEIDAAVAERSARAGRTPPARPG